ncbi:MAG: hypothetical protein Fur0028_06160 [Bacteroidales bacterium]
MNKNNEPLTHNIKQLGFSWLRGFGARFSVLVGGQARSPKSQPFHIVNVSDQAKRRQTMDKVERLGKEYIDHKLFGQLSEFSDFYDSLAHTTMGFMS